MFPSFLKSREGYGPAGVRPWSGGRVGVGWQPSPVTTWTTAQGTVTPCPSDARPSGRERGQVPGVRWCQDWCVSVLGLP